MIPPTLSLSGFRTNAPGDFEAFVAVLRKLYDARYVQERYESKKKKKETTSLAKVTRFHIEQSRNFHREHPVLRERGCFVVR